MNHYELGNPIKAFFEIDGYNYKQQIYAKIRSEIGSKGKEYILSVEENEYKNYLIEKYSIEALVVNTESETIEEPSISRETHKADVYKFIISYNFSGSSDLFYLQPNTHYIASTEIYVNDQARTVSFLLELTKKDPNEFNKIKGVIYNQAFMNLPGANSHVPDLNNAVKGVVNSYFQEQKNKYQTENDFFAAINVKINKDTNSVFTAPTIRKAIIPQPTVPKNKEFSSEPTMAMEMYLDTLKVIYELGKNMEKKPSTYQNKDEEGLRDQILLVLETRYEGITATGETFNRGGKTDIILKYAKDSSNLFVAECKFWHGKEEFLKAISQLFDRYLSWRDSKTALILFVKNKEFSNVLQSIQKEIKEHTYYEKESGRRGESSFSYIFHLPQDKDKMVFFEVMAFHYDK